MNYRRVLKEAKRCEYKQYNYQTPAKLRGKMWPPFGVYLSLSLSFWSPRSKQIHVVDSAIRFSSKGEQKKLKILKIQSRMVALLIC